MAAPHRRAGVLGVAVAAVVLSAGLGARQLAARARSGSQRANAAKGTPSPERGAGPTLRVPHLRASIVLDGDTDDPGWTSPPGPARTGAFVLAATGVPARPYSDVRAVWGDGHLYLALYAADEDIRSRTTEQDGPLWLDDSFRLVFTQGGVERAIEVSPRGIVTDAIRTPGGSFDYAWESGAHVSPELDGTLDDAKDSDEEWVIEMAIPFDALGLRGVRGETIGFAVHRCDVPKGSSRVCAGWGEGEARGALRLE